MDTLAIARLIADAPHATQGSFSASQWAAAERVAVAIQRMDTDDLWRFLSHADQIFEALSIAHTKWHPESPMGQYETARAKTVDILNRIDSQKESSF